MSHKIQNIIDWWDKFNDITMLISTKNKQIEINIVRNKLPHLLGLHYVNKDVKNYLGMKIRNFCYKKSDEEIFQLVKENHPEKLAHVKARVNTFQAFMKNLEKAYLVENTHPKSQISSQHFFIEKERKSNEYYHLGLLTINGSSELQDFGVINKKELSTYIVENNDSYFRKTKIMEKVKKIERYKGDELVPFFFDEKKQRQYDLAASQQVINEKPSIKDKITTYQSNIAKEDIATARDKPEQKQSKESKHNEEEL